MRVVLMGAAAATLALAVGTAILWPRGDTALYRVVDGTVQTGDTIQTNGGGAQLALVDGSRVEIRSQSELSVERADDGLRVRLSKGGIIVNAAQQRTGHLYVQTKDITVSVVGTIFLVDAAEEGSRVAVIEGEVRVQQGTTEQKLQPGDQVATSPRMESLSVKQEFAWSRRAAAHAAVLEQAILLTTVQNPANERLAFVEVSIRPRSPALADGGRGSGPSFECANTFQSDPSRFAIRNANVYTLVAMAHVPGGCVNARELDLISGGPGWTRSDRFDIEAVTPPGSPTFTRAQFFDGVGVEKLQMMIRTMLEERFKLVVHREMRERAAYVLAAGPEESKLKRWKEGDTVKDPETGQELARACGLLRFPDEKGQAASARINCLNVPMTAFVNSLSFITRRPVLDRTGMTGQFQFVVDFAEPDYVGASPSGLPSIATAIRDQFGLTFEAARAPVEILVIESAEKPSEN